MKQWRRVFVLSAIITMRLLILEIFYRDKSLMSVPHFSCKAIVSVYNSVYQKRFYRTAYSLLNFNIVFLNMNIFAS